MNKFNRILAVFFALAMILSCAACGSDTVQQEPVYATIGETEISSGIYNFMMFDAFNSVMDAHNVDYKKVYSTDIDGVTGEEYVRTQADEKFATLYTTDKLFQEMGLTDDAYSESMNRYYSSSAYSGNSDLFTTFGITEEDLYNTYAQDTRLVAIYNKLYGVGGEFEIPASEKQQKMADSYYRTQYIYYSMMAENATGADSGKPLPDTDAAQIRAKAQEYLDRYNAGEAFEDLVYEDELSNTDTDVDSAPTRLADYQYDYYFEKNDANTPAELLTALAAMKDEEARVVEGDVDGNAYLVVMRRLPINGTDDENWQGYAMNLCQSDYSDEFTAYIKEQTKNTEIDYNEAARELYTTSYFMERLKKYVFDAQVEALG